MRWKLLVRKIEIEYRVKKVKLFFRSLEVRLTYSYVLYESV